MDQFGFEQLAAWLAHRVILPPGPLLCVIDGPDPWSPLVRQRRSSRTARARRRCRGQAAVRAPSTAARACRRARARRSGDQHHPAPARSYRPGDHQQLPAGDRSQRDHRRRPLTPPGDHLCHRRADPLTAHAWQSPPAVPAAAPPSRAPRVPFSPPSARMQQPPTHRSIGDRAAADRAPYESSQIVPMQEQSSIRFLLLLSASNLQSRSLPDQPEPANLNAQRSAVGPCEGEPGHHKRGARRCRLSG